MKSNRNGYKKRVTKIEYNRWVKWLTKQGYSGPFAGLTTSHDWVRRLWSELRKEPPTILETNPRDRRTIVASLNRYGRKKGPPLPGQEDSFAGPTIITQYERYRHQHWVRLGRLAEELRLGLSFSPVFTYHEDDSRFGERVRGAWLWAVGESRVMFSAAFQGLFRCLLDHLDYEFQNPSFRTELEEFREIASAKIRHLIDQDFQNPSFRTELVELREIALASIKRLFVVNEFRDPSSQDKFEESLDIIAAIIRCQTSGDLKEITSHQLANSIRMKLWHVIERGTFKGTCEICRDWD